MNKKGFSLTEYMLSITVILVILAVAVPTIFYVIKKVRIDAFKNSAYSVIEATEYYLANAKYLKIPSEGISLDELDLDLKNNNFDEGIIREIEERQIEIISLKKGNFCAKGTRKNLEVTDKGCGHLDKTNPESVKIYIEDQTSTSLTVVSSAIDSESEIISYEFSIDGGKFTEKNSSNKYIFNDLKQGKHTIQVRVTNEAGLTKKSGKYTFETNDNSNIICSEKNDSSYVQKEKNISCKFPNGSDYIYEYSEDNTNWNQIFLTQSKYEFTFNMNKTLYLRVRNNHKLIATSTINISNIDDTLNNSYPSLLTNMIPVIYDQAKQIWIKADPNQIYWNYKDKNWANAVFVKKYADSDDPNSKSRDYYLSNAAIGNEVYEGDIIGYYVWIPRYKYVLFNVNGSNNIQNIVVNFESNKDNVSTGQIDDTYYNGEWYTHKAFTSYGNINGFWISKFNMSASDNTTCYLERTANDCNKSDILLYSLPNKNSLTNISISNAYLSTNNMLKKGNIYGLVNGNSHVLTNLEWGAITYLANSSYGIGKNLENNGKYYKNNLDSSTTGNITGVFDMVGSYNQMVMANYNQDAGLNESDNSGFKKLGTVEWPEIIDYYNGITSKSRILGDATMEVETWYNSNHEFVNGEKPFIIRGGVMNNISSIYNYSSYTGNSDENITFRTVLTNK